ALRPLVIIVDDDPALCSALKFSLETEGFRVETPRERRGAAAAPTCRAPTLALDQCEAGARSASSPSKCPSIACPYALRPLVIIVDDDPALCSALKFSLETEGFRVET
ncbi:hypothetical protein DM870_26445, partial [Escherichia coli]